MTTLIRNETFTHPVETPLTERELLVYADELASLDTEKTQIEQRFQSEKGMYKSEIEKIGSRSTVVFDRLRTKKEYKDIECYNDFNFFEGMCDIRRVDTDEVIKSRHMTADEYKQELPFKPAAADEDE